MYSQGQGITRQVRKLFLMTFSDQQGQQGLVIRKGKSDMPSLRKGLQCSLEDNPQTPLLYHKVLGAAALATCLRFFCVLRPRARGSERGTGKG